LQLVEGSGGEDRQRESPSRLFCGHISLQGILRKNVLFCLKKPAGYGDSLIQLHRKFFPYQTIMPRVFYWKILFMPQFLCNLRNIGNCSIVGGSCFPLYRKLLIFDQSTRTVKQLCCGSGSEFGLDLDPGAQK